MASTLFFCSDHGAAAGTPARGTTSSTGITNISFKNADDAGSDFAIAPVSAGSRSYDKFVFALWSGSFNSVGTVKWAHVSGTLGAGLQLVAGVSGSGFYRTPATTTNSLLPHDLTATGLVSTGLSVLVGAGGPHLSGKNASTTSSPAFSEFLGNQLVTTASASAGNCQLYHYSVSWVES